MTDPDEPPRPRDDALQDELESLRQQEREGHATPKEQRRAEQLERRRASTSTAPRRANAGIRIARPTGRTRRSAHVIAADPRVVIRRPTSSTQETEYGRRLRDRAAAGDLREAAGEESRHGYCQDHGRVRAWAGRRTQIAM